MVFTIFHVQPVLIVGPWAELCPSPSWCPIMMLQNRQFFLGCAKNSAIHSIWLIKQFISLIHSRCFEKEPSERSQNSMKHFCVGCFNGLLNTRTFLLSGNY